MRFDERHDDETLIRLEGVLDGIVARRVEARLARAKPGARFHIDLTQIREFHDFGVAVLGHALTLSQARVSLRGLRQHQVRIVRHFGVETAPLERAMLADEARRPRVPGARADSTAGRDDRRSPLERPRGLSPGAASPAMNASCT